MRGGVRGVAFPPHDRSASGVTVAVPILDGAIRSPTSRRGRFSWKDKRMSIRSTPAAPTTEPLIPIPSSYSDGRICKLRLISPYTALPLAERDALEPLSRRIALNPKQNLFGQDEPAGSIYNVTSGTLCLYCILPDGRRQVTGFAVPGDFLGLSLLDRFSVSADALGPVTACWFDRRSFVDLVCSQPGLMMHLHEITGHELTRAKDMMVLLGRRTAEEKIAVFLTGLWGRYARTGQSAVTLKLPMNRLDIADHLGLTIETVCRTLTRLDREGCIRIVPGGVRLIDHARLDRLSAR